MGVLARVGCRWDDREGRGSGVTVTVEGDGREGSAEGGSLKLARPDEAPQRAWRQGGEDFPSKTRELGWRYLARSLPPCAALRSSLLPSCPFLFRPSFCTIAAADLRGARLHLYVVCLPL